VKHAPMYRKSYFCSKIVDKHQQKFRVGTKKSVSRVSGNKQQFFTPYELQGEDENGIKLNDQLYQVGDFVYIEPR